MENQVPEQVKSQRSEILLALNEKKRLAYEKSFIGKEVEVTARGRNRTKWQEKAGRPYKRVYENCTRRG